MAWNGSSGSGERPQSKPRQPKKRPQGLLVAVGVFVALAGICFVAWVMSVGEKPSQKPDEPRKVKKPDTVVASDTKPAKSVTQEENPGVRTNRWGKVVKRVKPETYVDARGVLRYKNGNARVPNPDDFKNPIRIERSTGLPHFNHPVEDEIATLISVTPGETLVGEISYRGFNSDFVNALLDKIEFSDDDSDYDREIKQGVIEVKKDLAERIKNGEDLVQILKDARSELMRSAEYKNQIGDFVREQLLDPTVSDDEFKDAISAANKLLESKGIAPIKETKFLRARERVLRLQERKAAMSPQN